jgi:acyl transferase domain-containing protein
VASRALADAGYADRAFPREKTGVIIGRGGYAGPGRTRLEQHVRTAEQLVVLLRGLLPRLTEAELSSVKREFQGKLGAAGPDAAIGLVPNLAASRIANRLDLRGPSYTVDAACASSLLAVDQAVRELTSGRCDLVLAGGVHLCHDEAFWSVFTQLGALSRREQIRPFDRRADGLLIGEGVGIVALKRRADAERDDDRIYAVVRGTGVGSDGRDASLMTPLVEGQLLALKRAWAAAGLPPQSVGLVEAHGTGTPAGDAAELLTLRRFFGEASAGEPRVPLGSVKSMIGHAMPAAGAASLIKAALALHHGVVPPSLHCEEPREELLSTRFRIPSEAEPWDRNVVPRRAAVNAFGFGGINAHVVLEEVEARPASRQRPAGVDAAHDEQLLLLSAASPEALLAALARGGLRDASGGTGAARLALVDPTEERLARAKLVVEKGKPWRGREGIWFSPRGLLADGGLIAFLFPGVDASFSPRVEDVASHFGLAAPPSSSGDLTETGVGIIAVNRLLHRVLGELGVRPDLIAGHSIGEWSGLIAAGIIPETALDSFVATIKPGSLRVPGVVFAAAGCGVEQAGAAMEGLSEIALSHDNCPHQIILCGRESSVDAALGRLRAGGVLCQKLPFVSGFHSPLFADYLGPHRENLSALPLHRATVPFYSATTCAPYPEDPGAIRSLALDHLVQPVRFRELVEALYARGARVFVQVGTGSLVGFVEDTLRGRPHLAWSANVPQRAGLSQLRRLLAALYVEGASPDVSRLSSARPVEARRLVPLSLGVPLVRLERPPLDLGRPGPPEAHPKGSLAAELARGLSEIADAEAEVTRKFSRDSHRPENRVSLPARPQRALDVTTERVLSVAEMPALRDHCFFRQPDGWPSLADRYPVVPMTTLLSMMMEAATDLVPDRIAVRVEAVQALRWLAVAKPVPARFRTRYDGESRVHVSIEGFAEGTVVLADAFPPAPPPDVTPLQAEGPAPISAAQLYSDRWMFHGPAFQGVVEVGPLGRDGLRGVIETPAAPGALLDNAGQLLGLWVMLGTQTDRMAMPVKLGRVVFHGPPPAPGERVSCTVRIRSLGVREVIADLTLDRGGHRWVEITGWEDRRFETDARLWPVMVFPERTLLAEPQEGGYLAFRDRYRSAPTRDQLARRFLSERERADYEAQPPRRQRSWLNERIAGKDAVREFVMRVLERSIFPAEVLLEGGDDRRGPSVTLLTESEDRDLRLSVAHGEDLAVALLAEGREPGIAVARISNAGTGRAASSGLPDEALLRGQDDPEEWLGRLQAAREAAAKAKGLQADEVGRVRVTDRAGERLLVDNLWVATKREGEQVIAWTIV